jgi:hypothetical protein
MKIGFILLAALLFASGEAQSAANAWDAVSALTPGQQVRIHTGSERHEGTLSAVSENGLTLTPASGQAVTLSRSEVQRVYIRTKSHRVRTTIIGTAVGVAAGVVLYGTLGSWFRNEGRDDTAWMLGVPIGIGAGVSAALPTGGMRKIYDAHR